ncbi:MAG: DNA phosphorothioation system sulfurtransferase DndC [Saprospiraceae bacterium]|nr:DNA phosphorothioation system sulfurtransferase DndC [Saprospiraceae bacterium]
MTLTEKIRNIAEEIQNQFLADDIPWVIGYSGGKDSTAVVQLVLYALLKLPKEKLKKEIHILSNDTLVENPTIVSYIDAQLKLIETAGKLKLYDHKPNHFQVIKVTPKIEDRFWINLIGKGYPSPNRWFRWCTDRMKINPTNDYILKTVSKHGRAIIVLGARKTESSNRAKTMEKYNLEGISENGSKFRKHSLPNAWVYAPINELTTDEVWTYLMQVPSFWGGDNKKLITMYRNASESANECPLVIDTSTASCGNSRFGCWVCTVVKRDKSMENLIENGEEWMIPMLDFRNYLAELREDETKRLKMSRDNKDRLGPFNFNTRAELLTKLLEIEVQTGLEIISKQELAAIQLQWNYDGSFHYHVGDIYLNIKNKPLMLDNRQLQEKEKEELELLREVATQHQVNADHIRTLLLTEKEYVTFLRRRNILDDIQKKIEGFVKEDELTEKDNV